MAAMALRVIQAAFNENSQPVKGCKALGELKTKACLLMLTRNRRFNYPLPETKTDSRVNKLIIF
jgi:hypothetical protein